MLLVTRDMLARFVVSGVEKGVTMGDQRIIGLVVFCEQNHALQPVIFAMERFFGNFLRLKEPPFQYC